MPHPGYRRDPLTATADGPFCGPRRSVWLPHHELLSAVLQRALCDIADYPPDHKISVDAWSWIMGGEPEGTYLTEFKTVCTILNLCPEAVRTVAAQLRSGTLTRPEVSEFSWRIKRTLRPKAA